MALFFIYAGSKGGGLESTLGPYEIAKELGIDAHLFLSKDNERKELIRKLYPEAEFFNFLSPGDILKMRKRIGDGWSFFTMISPKMLPLFFSIRKKKLFYFHGTFETAYFRPSFGGWVLEKMHDMVIKDSTLTFVPHPHLIWEIKLRLNRIAEVLPHPSYILREGLFADEKQFKLPFDRYFLYFGEVDREGKGVSVLLKALQQHPELNTIMAGRGGNLPKLTNLAHMKGWISDGEMHYLIKNAEATLVPYLIPAQFSGCMALSFHFRTPVIASNLPTFQDCVVDEKTGWLFTSGDSIALGKLMKDVWDGKHTYSKEAIVKKEEEMKESTKRRLKEILEQVGYSD